ncbi:GTP-binding protein REM 2 [Takifugu rubripes]|uniref:RAS (RAD and GEM)-like GTP binding 2 n=1 Tax=Takifugu rubripes TaxID=31033 RepID=H2RKA0_TAKRU|nr:GTP-binding protein REM 2 [Takifugu rubripes]|eukprot:XP_003978756.2 PREDICTED: GTP-binding protein REM 2-like [Takifugu rubripes]
MADQYSMFLNTAAPLRRGSTPLPVKHQLRREEAISEDCDWIPGLEEPAALPVTDTAVPRDESFGQSAAAQSSFGHGHGSGALRIVLLGQNGVGKSSLALSLAGQSDRSLSIDSETQACGEGYESTVTVDDEDSKLIVFDNWKQDLSTLQCDVCVLVFSVTDRRSFHRTAQLRLLLRESQPHTPIILVGNKSDLVRSREISSEEAQSSAMMFDCLYMELSASLDHGTNELLEAAVRTARGDSVGPGWTDGDPGAGRRESLTSRAKRFLAGLVPRSYGRDRDRDRGRYREMSRHRGSKILRQKSRSCHDLSAL